MLFDVHKPILLIIVSFFEIVDTSINCTFDNSLCGYEFIGFQQANNSEGTTSG